MKPTLFVGVVFIFLGALALAYQGITYTTREKIIKIGPIEATEEVKKTIPWRCRGNRINYNRC